MQTKTFTTETGAKKAAARAYSPAIARLANGRYAWFHAGQPLPQGARSQPLGHQPVARIRVTGECDGAPVLLVLV